MFTDNNSQNSNSSMSWAALAAAGLTTAGAVANNFIQGGQTKKQRDWSELMMDKQNQWSVDMYNQYQSPEALRRQLNDAGINPLSQDMANGSMPTSASPNQYSLPSFNNPIAEGMNAYIQAKQATNIDADTEQKNAETARTYKMTPVEVRKVEEEANSIHQSIQNALSDKRRTDEEIKSLQIANKWANAEHKMSLEKVITDIKVNNSLARLNDQQQKNINYELENLLPLDKLIKEKDGKKIDAQIDEILANIKRISKETDLSELDIVNYSWNHSSGTNKSLRDFLGFSREVASEKPKGKNPLSSAGDRVKEFVNSGLEKLYSRLLEAYDLQF